MNSMAEVLAGVVEGNNDGRRLIFSWNDDVLMEILLWLPAKSVIRFKSVCKNWLSMLSSDKFCHLHTLSHPKLQSSLMLGSSKLQFFYFDPIMNGKTLMIPYSFSVPDPRLMSVCNGLMLLSTYDPDWSLHVYNPATKQSRKINPHDHSGKKARIMAIELAFDPSESPHYMVVCIMPSRFIDSCPCENQINVYDSESHTWKLKEGPHVLPIEIFFPHKGAYWNGSIYWDTPQMIFRYNIARNDFKYFSRPRYPWNQDQGADLNADSYLQESDGRLYQCRLVTDDDDNCCLSIQVFELQVGQDRSRWLLKHNDNIISHCYPTSSCAHELRFMNRSYTAGKCCFVCCTCGRIFVYSFLDRRIEEAAKGEADWDSYGFRECLAVV